MGEPCGICDCCDGGIHWGAMHRMADRITNIAHALADRIAKLEAWREQMVNPIPAEDAPARETTAAAGPIPPGHKLAPGWEVRTENCNCTWNSHFRGYAPPGVEGDRCGRPGSYYYQGYATSCAAHAVELGALVKVEPPMAKPVHRSGTHFAEQPVSAADELPLPFCGQCFDAGIICEGHKPPAPAPGAPAEPLSDFAELPSSQKIREAGKSYAAGLRIVGWESMADEVAALETRLDDAEREDASIRKWNDRLAASLADAKAKLADAEAKLAKTKADAVRLAQVATESLTADCVELRTRLAAAEREREELKQAVITTAQTGADAAATAVAAERERCLALVQRFISNASDMYEVRDAIRDGRPAQK